MSFSTKEPSQLNPTSAYVNGSYEPNKEDEFQNNNRHEIHSIYPSNGNVKRNEIEPNENKFDTNPVNISDSNEIAKIFYSFSNAVSSPIENAYQYQSYYNYENAPNCVTPNTRLKKESSIDIYCSSDNNSEFNGSEELPANSSESHDFYFEEDDTSSINNHNLDFYIPTNHSEYSVASTIQIQNNYNSKSRKKQDKNLSADEKDESSNDTISCNSLSLSSKRKKLPRTQSVSPSSKPHLTRSWSSNSAYLSNKSGSVDMGSGSSYRTSTSNSIDKSSRYSTDNSIGKSGSEITIASVIEDNTESLDEVIDENKLIHKMETNPARKNGVGHIHGISSDSSDTLIGDYNYEKKSNSSNSSALIAQKIRRSSGNQPATKPLSPDGPYFPQGKVCRRISCPEGVIHEESNGTENKQTVFPTKPARRPSLAARRLSDLKTLGGHIHGSLLSLAGTKSFKVRKEVVQQ